MVLDRCPPLGLDLFVESAYAIQEGGKVTADLKTAIHATPEKLKSFLLQNWAQEVGRKGAADEDEQQVNLTAKTATVSRGRNDEAFL